MFVLHHPPEYIGRQLSMLGLLTNPVSLFTVSAAFYLSYKVGCSDELQGFSKENDLTFQNKSKIIHIFSSYIDYRPQILLNESPVLRILLLQNYAFNVRRRPTYPNKTSKKSKKNDEFKCLFITTSDNKIEQFFVVGTLHYVGEYSNTELFTPVMLSCPLGVKVNSNINSNWKFSIFINTEIRYGWKNLPLRTHLPERSLSNSTTICIMPPLDHKKYSHIRLRQFISYYQQGFGVTRFVFYNAKLDSKALKLLDDFSRTSNTVFVLINWDSSNIPVQEVELNNLFTADCVFREHNFGASKFSTVLSDNEYLKLNGNFYQILEKYGCIKATSCVVLAKDSDCSTTDFNKYEIDNNTMEVAPPGQSSRVIFNLQTALDVGPHMIFSSVMGAESDGVVVPPEELVIQKC